MFFLTPAESGKKVARISSAGVKKVAERSSGWWKNVRGQVRELRIRQMPAKTKMLWTVYRTQLGQYPYSSLGGTF